MADLGQLIEVPSPNTSPKPYTVNVIVIPEIGSRYCWQTWSDGSGCWLWTLLPEALGHPFVLEFEHHLPRSGFFEWQHIVEAGDHLLDLLVDRARSPLFATRPILLLCHGFGGTIMKRVIGAMNEQFHKPQFRNLLGNIAGIVLLASPHPRFEVPQEWRRLVSILKSLSKISKKEANQLLEHAAAIADISRKFDEAGSHVPILSTYESKPTKIFGSRWTPGRTASLLVDQSYACTGAKFETLIEADTNHENACQAVPNGPLSNALKEFLPLIRNFVSLPTAEDASRYAQSLTDWTIASETNPDVAIEREYSAAKTDTNAALQGSSVESEFQIVPSSQGMTAAVQPVELPCYMLKPHTPDPSFYNRPEVVEALRQNLYPHLKPNQNSSSLRLTTFALCGAGGVGKTRMAVEFAYASKSVFDAIFFLHASDTAKLAQGFANISIQLGLETSASAGDQLISRDLVISWMTEPRRYTSKISRRERGTNPPKEPNWLLIFDNADDLDLLADYWPISNHGSILVTSRDPLAKTRCIIPIEAGIDLDPFNTKDAATLLRNLTGFNAPQYTGISEEVAAELSGFPIAITQVAKMVGRRRLSLEELLKMYRDQSVRLDIHQSNIGSNSKSLATVWALEDLSPGAQMLINFLAFLDPDQIPEKIFTDVFQSDDPLLVPHNYFPSEGAFMEARTELLRSSLIKRNIDLKEITIHRIIQDATRLRMDKETMQLAFNGISQLLYIVWPFSFFEASTKRWRMCEPIVPHIQNLVQFYDSRSVGLEGQKTPKPYFPRLIQDYGWYLLERGSLDDARPLFRLAEELCKDDEKSTIVLGNIYYCQFYVAIMSADVSESLRLSEAAFQFYQTHNNGHWKHAQGYKGLSDAHILAEDFEKGLEESQLSIDVYAEFKKHDDKGELQPGYDAWAQMNKGLCLCQLSRYDEAVTVLEDYLKHCEDIFGGPMDTETMKTGLCYQYLGNVRRCQKYYGQSLGLFSQALTQFLSTIGPKHYRTGAVYSELGEAYVLLNLLNEARSMFVHALETFAERPAHYAPIAFFRFRLANILSLMKRDSESAEEVRKTNKILTVLSLKHGRQITEENLYDLIPTWCRPTKSLQRSGR